MKTLIALACTAVIFGAMGFTSSEAAMMASPAKALVASPADSIVNITFWARPYPYGYSSWRRCPDGVRVRTPYGWRCSTAVYREGEPVLRSRG